MLKNRILIIGGYGQVGKYVTLELVKFFPEKIIVAGRNIDKANSFAQEYNNTFDTLKIDIYDKEHIVTKLKDIKIVVMCLTPKNNDFVKHCIKNGISYIDISPSYDIAKNIEEYKNEAKINQTTCVLGVGLVPGLSNLIVKKLSENNTVLKNVNIHLMLGVGESHGKDGVNWLLDNIQKDYIVNNKNVKPFKKSKKAFFIYPLGERKTYPFNLADQFIIIKTLPVETASSYFCYDSKIITFFVSLLKCLCVFNLLKFNIFNKLVSNLFNTTLHVIQKLKVGTDIFSLKIDVIGIKHGKEHVCSAGIIGNNNSLFTAKVTSLVAKKLYLENHPFGVFYIEELFSLNDLEKNDICSEVVLIEN